MKPGLTARLPADSEGNFHLQLFLPLLAPYLTSTTKPQEGWGPRFRGSFDCLRSMRYMCMCVCVSSIYITDPIVFNNY